MPKVEVFLKPNEIEALNKLTGIQKYASRSSVIREAVQNLLIERGLLK